LTRREWALALTLTLVLHALFALVLWNEMRSSPAHPTRVHADINQVLVVRLLDQTSTPPAAQPPAPPAPPQLTASRQGATPHARPITHEKPRRGAMVVQDHETAPAQAASVATAADNSVFAKDGSVRLPPPTNHWAPQSAKAKQPKPADDRRIMQHDLNRMHTTQTRFEKYFPPPNETAGGALGRHMGDALKKIAKSICNPKKSSMATNMLCAAPPLPPSSKDRDERISLPSAPLAGNPHPAKPLPLATCITIYKASGPLPYGCPINTPDLAFKAEMQVCIDLFRAGKRLKTWCPPDTPKRAAAESKKRDGGH
jgi:hypothetical protein